METNEVLARAIAYNGSDVRRINHLVKVHAFARHIGLEERCSEDVQRVLEIAAILHDIGIHEAERKHLSSAGHWQEVEGPPVARELLHASDGLDNDSLERVLFLIGRHHSYNAVDGIDFQILVEADFLVNIFEDEMDRNAIESIREKIFKTQTGIRLLNLMYLEQKGGNNEGTNAGSL
jgi:hypothetical protein